MAQISPQARFHRRLYVVYVLMVVVALVFVYRLIHLQIIHHETFVRMAENQYIGVASGVLERGDIYFTSKDGEYVTAATIKHGYKIFVNPSIITEPEALIASLGEALRTGDSSYDEEHIRGRLARTDDTYEEVVFRLSAEEAQTIRELNLDGVGLAADQWRSYPGDTTASHVLGFVGFREHTLEGRYGLEGYYEDVLRRSPDKQSINFFAQVYTGDESARNEALRDFGEGDLITSIEPHVQRFLDTQVQGVQEQWGSAYTAGLVIDPTTGQVVALTTSEEFNLNDRSSITSEQLPNPFVEHVYEMGSIIKPLIMAMAFQEHVASPATAFYDTGSVEVGKYTIHNFDKKGRGQITMTEVLQQSLNTGMVWISQHLARNTMKGYLHDLQLHEKTNVDLPYEIASLTSNLDRGREVEYANVSFGQGIALTPIATVRALSVLANHGRLPQPHIVTSIDKKRGGRADIEHLEQDQIFSEETVEEITRILVGLVDDAFKDEYPALGPYSVAAKTGTAQIAHPEGGYYDDRNLHSFFGYFPAYDPEYLVFYFTIHPKNVRYSSETLSDPFMRTAQFLVEYYNIPPDRVLVQ
jgi:cell division protein FtsI/penicillin-binding protein 2